MAWRLITLCIILINWFFVATEFALVKVRISQLALRVKEGDKRAQMVSSILEKIDSYLSTTQLGITLCSLALWRIGGDAIAQGMIHIFDYFWWSLPLDTAETIAIPLAFVILTMVQVIVGELIPKCLAIQNPMKYALASALPLMFLYRILFPFVRFMQKIYRFILRLLGVHDVKNSDVHSEEEIKLLLTQSEEQWQIESTSNELIQNVFDFDDRQVREIMTPSHKLFAIDRKKRQTNHIDILIREGYSRIPVYEDQLDNVVWWILFKDIVSSYMKYGKIDIDKLIRPIQYVPENMWIVDCLKFFQQSRLHIAMVSSEYGTIIGVVTMEDILEELVGDIHDEGDEHHAIVTMVEDGHYIVDATASIVDVNQHFIHHLPLSDEYETVAGYVNHLWGRIPSLHESIETDHYTITVTKRKKQRIDQVRLKVREE